MDVTNKIEKIEVTVKTESSNNSIRSGSSLYVPSTFKKKKKRFLFLILKDMLSLDNL